jgi:hypothetical protein
MTQPPASGRGPADEPARDPRLPGFAQGGGGETRPPSAALAAEVADLSGPEWRCQGADDEELIGLLGRWEALGAWAEAGKLGVVRELIRRRARPGVSGYLPMHGDLPDQWHQGIAHEVSAALGISIRSADNLIVLAWDLQARLPGTGAALAAGLLSPLKAKIISEELKVLDDDLAGQAEKLILDQVTPLTTPGQLGKLAARAVCTVDPGGAAKRREHAEREHARIAFWREHGGACALAAYGLPTDAALAANDAIEDLAQQYKRAKIRPDARMDQLRVLAFLDLLNGITPQARIDQSRAGSAAAQRDGTGTTHRGCPQEPDPAGAAGADDRPDDDCPDDDWPDDDWPDDDFGDSGEPAASGPKTSGSDAADGDSRSSGRAGDGSGAAAGDDSTAGGSAGGAAAAPALPALTARANLTFPLATLLGLADRPGAAHGLGALDPALVRDLAATAANSPNSQWCMTITDGQGRAVGHGCAKPARTTTATPRPPAATGPPAAPRGRSPRAANQDRPADTAAGRSPCPAAAN